MLHTRRSKGYLEGPKLSSFGVQVGSHCPELSHLSGSSLTPAGGGFPTHFQSLLLLPGIGWGYPRRCHLHSQAPALPQLPSAASDCQMLPPECHPASAFPCASALLNIHQNCHPRHFLPLATSTGIGWRLKHHRSASLSVCKIPSICSLDKGLAQHPLVCMSPIGGFSAGQLGSHALSLVRLLLSFTCILSCNFTFLHGVALLKSGHSSNPEIRYRVQLFLPLV